jgi:hypothetical protein
MPRQPKYSREFIMVLRERWSKRLTHKALAEEIKEKPEAMNYLLNAPLDVVCGKSKEHKEHSQLKQTTKGAECGTFYVEHSGEQNADDSRNA